MTASLETAGRGAACYCRLARRTSSALTALYERELLPHGLTLPQFSLLRVAERHAPLGVSELADRLHIDRTTLARNLKPLEKDGLVRFAPSERDAREKWVVVTAGGKRRLARASVSWKTVQEDLEKRLGTARLAALADLAEAVAAL
jgi:DNA-binding MarR family transcriptional regulator